MKTVHQTKNWQWLKGIAEIICFFVPCLLIVPWRQLPQVSDFMMYYAVSELMQSGRYDQIYNLGAIIATEKTLVANSLHGYCPFLVTPILSWIFYPLSWFQFNCALYFWTAISLILIFVSVLVLCESLRIEGGKRLWLIILVGLFGPTLESIRLGQLSSVFLFAAVSLFIALKRQAFIKSAFWQSLFWLKPHLILPALFFELANKRIKLVIVTICAAIVELAVALAFGGMSIINNYINLLHNQQFWRSGPTLAVQILKLSHQASSAFIFGVVVYVLLMLGALVLGKRIKRTEQSGNILLTVVMPLTLCLCPYLFNYDLLLLVPGILLLASYSLVGFCNRLRIFLFVVIAATMTLPGYMPLYYVYLRNGGLINCLFWATLTFGTGALIIEWKRQTF